MITIKRALRIFCLGLLPVVSTPGAYGGDVSNAPADPRAGVANPQNDTGQRDLRDKPKRGSASTSGSSLFDSRTWTPPVVEQPRVAVAKAPPSPPRFPYEFMGRMESDGKPDTVYLTKDNNVYAVTVGDTIEGAYRVMGIAPDRLEVTYLPLGTKQQIAFLSIVAAAQPQGITNTYVNPALPPSVNVPVPAPFNLAPMFDTARPADSSPQRGSQRSADPDAANRAAAANQPAPPQSGSGAAPPAPSAAPAVVAPTLVPTPVLVSPPTVSGFSSPLPAGGNTAGATPNAAGARPATPGPVQPNDPVSVPGGAPSSDVDANGATGGSVDAQVGGSNAPAPARR